MDNTTAYVVSAIVVMFGFVISAVILKRVNHIYQEMKACVTYRATTILYPEVKLNEDHLDDSPDSGERLENPDSSEEADNR